MKIWVIGRSYPTKQNKMRGSFELEQAKLLASHGHEVIYMAVVMHPINKIQKWGAVEFDDENVRVYVESFFFTPERLHVHLKWLNKKLWRSVFDRVVSKHGLPDVIHIHYPGMNCVPELVDQYRQKGVRIVTTEHWTKVLKDTMDSFQRKQLIEFSKVTDKLLCVGEPLKESIKRITQTTKDIEVVPNVVTSIFRPADKSSDASSYQFIATGRLAPVKQMDQIVQAFVDEFKNDEGVFLTIVGGGNERTKIEKIIENSHMESRVTLTGALSRSETAEHVAKADSLICFSRLETFGVPVIEAWACGIPVIASDALGFLEYWNEYLGCIVSCRDIDALKAAMRRVYENKDSYNADYLAQFASENFGEEAIYHKLLEAYENQE